MKKKKIRSTYTKNFFAMCKILYIRIGVSLNFLEYISQFCNIIRIQWLRKPLFNLHILLVSCENSAIKDRFNSTSNIRWMPIYSDTLMMKYSKFAFRKKRIKVRLQLGMVDVFEKPRTLSSSLLNSMSSVSTGESQFFANAGLLADYIGCS